MMASHPALQWVSILIFSFELLLPHDPLDDVAAYLPDSLAAFHIFIADGNGFRFCSSRYVITLFYDIQHPVHRPHQVHRRRP